MKIPRKVWCLNFYPDGEEGGFVAKNEYNDVIMQLPDQVSANVILLKIQLLQIDKFLQNILISFNVAYKLICKS